MYNHVYTSIARLRRHYSIYWRSIRCKLRKHIITRVIWLHTTLRRLQSLSTNLILANFYRYNDFACISNNKWITTTMPMR